MGFNITTVLTLETTCMMKVTKVLNRKICGA